MHLIYGFRLESGFHYAGLLPGTVSQITYNILLIPVLPMLPQNRTFRDSISLLTFLFCQNS